MTILNMSQTEIDRLEVISRVNEKRLTLLQAGDILGLSKRQVQRLVNKYRKTAPLDSFPSAEINKAIVVILIVFGEAARAPRHWFVSNSSSSMDDR